MSGLRELAYNAVLASNAYRQLFDNVTEAEAALYPAGSPDSPLQRRWVVLAWGGSDSPLGRDSNARVQTLLVWAYDRDLGYSWVNLALRAVTDAVKALEGSVGTGYSVAGVNDFGAGPDGYDDVFLAAFRTHELRVAGRES